MENNQNTAQKSHIEDNEIDLIALAKTLWNGRKTVIKTTLIFMAIGLFVSIFSQKEYTSYTSFVPQTSDGVKLVPEHRELETPPHPFTGQPQGQDLNLSQGVAGEGSINKKGQSNAMRGHANRQRFIIDEIINVYPDTLCWISDFTYSFNEPYTNMYFWHPSYDNYPVVGVNWKQAKAFSYWRTELMNAHLSSKGEVAVNEFRLPTEVEWEWAARGGWDMNPYPWGGPYIRNSRGCFLGNF